MLQLQEMQEMTSFIEIPERVNGFLLYLASPLPPPSFSSSSTSELLLFILASLSFPPSIFVAILPIPSSLPPPSPPPNRIL